MRFAEDPWLQVGKKGKVTAAPNPAHSQQGKKPAASLTETLANSSQQGGKCPAEISPRGGKSPRTTQTEKQNQGQKRSSSTGDLPSKFWEAMEIRKASESGELR